MQKASQYSEPRYRGYDGTDPVSSTNSFLQV